ncbi:MAG: hypothetical protein HKP42_12855, partial [Maribacter sp.]|nr:hypothetical protein [Maribacter sp.]
PILAIFLVSFNTKDVYIPIEYKNGVSLNTEPTSEIIEITIDKNTTDKQLSDIKKDLAKKGVDFSYTVVHNSKNEITDISIDFTVKKENGKTVRSSSNFNNGDDPIDPIHIIYDEDTNSISMGSKKHMHKGIHKEIHIDTDEDTDKTIWVHADNEGDELKTIEIREEKGKETIRVNGKKVSRKEFDAMKDKDGIHEKHIRIKKSEGDEEENIFIMKMSDDHDDEDHDFELKTVEISEENGKETIRVNGKKVTREELDAMKDKDGIHEKRIKIIKSDNDKEKNVFIMKMSDDEEDESDILKVKEGKDMLFISSDSDEKPLFIIDGKESKEKDMKQLDSSEIATINVYKGEKAQEKYGDKGKNGVVEITTKNQK